MPFKITAIIRKIKIENAFCISVDNIEISHDPTIIENQITIITSESNDNYFKKEDINKINYYINPPAIAFNTIIHHFPAYEKQQNNNEELNTQKSSEERQKDAITKLLLTKIRACNVLEKLNNDALFIPPYEIILTIEKKINGSLCLDNIEINFDKKIAKNQITIKNSWLGQQFTQREIDEITNCMNPLISNLEVSIFDNKAYKKNIAKLLQYNLQEKLTISIDVSKHYLDPELLFLSIIKKADQLEKNFREQENIVKNQKNIDETESNQKNKNEMDNQTIDNTILPITRIYTLAKQQIDESSSNQKDLHQLELHKKNIGKNISLINHKDLACTIIEKISNISDYNHYTHKYKLEKINSELENLKIIEYLIEIESEDLKKKYEVFLHQNKLWLSQQENIESNCIINFRVMFFFANQELFDVNDITKQALQNLDNIVSDILLLKKDFTYEKTFERYSFLEKISASFKTIKSKTLSSIEIKHSELETFDLNNKEFANSQMSIVPNNEQNQQSKFATSDENKKSKTYKTPNFINHGLSIIFFFLLLYLSIPSFLFITKHIDKSTQLQQIAGYTVFEFLALLEFGKIIYNFAKLTRDFENLRSEKKWKLAREITLSLINIVGCLLIMFGLANPTNFVMGFVLLFSTFVVNLLVSFKKKTNLNSKSISKKKAILSICKNTACSAGIVCGLLQSKTAELFNLKDFAFFLNTNTTINAIVLSVILICALIIFISIALELTIPEDEKTTNIQNKKITEKYPILENKLSTLSYLNARKQSLLNKEPPPASKYNINHNIFNNKIKPPEKIQINTNTTQESQHAPGFDEKDTTKESRHAPGFDKDLF